jgi:hypothetical protein
MERLRAIIGFTTNELNELCRQAQKVANKTDDNTENRIEKWSHKEFRKTGDGRVFRNESDYIIECEKIRRNANKRFGVGAYHDSNGKEKRLKKRYLQKNLRDAKYRATQQYLNDHPNLEAKYQLLKKLDEVRDNIRFGTIPVQEWRNTRVVIQA